MSQSTPSAAWRVETTARGVSTLWFDTPGRVSNVLDRSAIEGLDARLAELETASDVEGVIVRSAKEAGFCVGFDHAAILAADAAEVRALAVRGREVLDRLAAFPRPTAAILHGDCRGAGLELALACRRRVALASSESLRLGASDVLLGLVPALGLIDRLASLLEPRDALMLLMSGRSVGYLMAKSLGIVDRLASLENVQEIHELLNPEASAARVHPAAEWETALADARSELGGEPSAHQEAELEILEVMATFAVQGPGAARAAAIESFVTLAARAETRHALESALARGEI